MNLHQLIQQIVYGNPGGKAMVLEALNYARTTQMSVQQLTNKLNPFSESATLNIQELERIADCLNCNKQVAEHFAGKGNAVVVPLPDADDVTGDMGLLDTFLRTTLADGEFAAEFNAAWADGRITKREFLALKEKMHRTVAKRLSLLAEIERLVG